MPLGDIFILFSPYLWSNSPLLDHKGGKKIIKNLIPKSYKSVFRSPLKTQLKLCY